MAPKWPDWVVAACQVWFALALIPALAAGPPPDMWTSGATAAGMIVMGVALDRQGMFFGLVASWVVAALWTALLIKGLALGGLI